MKASYPHVTDELLVAASAIGLVSAGGAGGSFAVAVGGVPAAVVGATLVAELEGARRCAARALEERFR